MPRGHEHISFVFRALFGTFFLKVFLELDCNGKKDPCAAFGFNNDRGLRCRPIEVQYFLKLSADKVLVFK